MSAKIKQGLVSIQARNAARRAFPPWVREAGLPDAGAIVSLVNTAYRPNASNRGWTHEADIIAGLRIDHGQVTELFLRPDSVILIGHHETRLAACVHVQKMGLSSYIGLLAVRPELQGSGVGSRMLDHAEQYALSHFLSTTVVMTVITRRTELISFYLSRGYQLTGKTESYPVSAGVGLPKCPNLRLSKLVKSLR
jgi:GNAT superfamily N-acetyltransferase